MAGAGVPASIADRAAIVAALQVLCALPECVRGALNARGFNAGFRPHRKCPNWWGVGNVGQQAAAAAAAAAAAEQAEATGGKGKKRRAGSS